MQTPTFSGSDIESFIFAEGSKIDACKSQALFGLRH
jgi:hypothetical protein